MTEVTSLSCRLGYSQSILDFKVCIAPIGAFLVAQSVKNLLAVQETQLRSLGQEDLLKKEMANYFSILA